MATITWADFEKVEMRVGKVTAVDEFPEARKPAYKLTVDFGPQVGVKRSSVQATHYPKAELLGRQLVCVTNFAPKQVGPFISEVLVLGAYDADGTVILLRSDREVTLGSRIG